MNKTNYFVTYCVMDTEAGANPFGHSFLMFSQQAQENAPISVVNCIGHYSQPNTSTNPIISGIKKAISLDVDLQDGHGVSLQEPMRTIDGNGLTGVSFSLTEAQYNALYQDYLHTMEQEQEAINELNEELTKQNVMANGYTRHIAEKQKALQENRPPRLQPFHVTMSLKSHGFDTSGSYTCKNRSLDMLQKHKIIDQQLRQELNSTRMEHAFPRFSSYPLPTLRLLSTGTPKKHLSKNGKIYYNHDWESNYLFWATPIVVYPNRPNKEQELYCELIKRTATRIVNVQNKLFKALDESSDRQANEQLSKHLQRVNYLKTGLIKPQINSDITLLNQRMSEVDTVLNCALLALEPDRINSTFMLRVYNSVAAHSAVAALLGLIISAALITVNPIAGIALCGVTTAALIHNMHRFYQEEKEFALTKDNYDNPSVVDSLSILTPTC